jgi:hypothetical protein
VSILPVSKQLVSDCVVADASEDDNVQWIPKPSGYANASGGNKRKREIIPNDEDDYYPEGDNSDDNLYEVPKKEPKTGNYPHVDAKYRRESTGPVPASPFKPKPTARPTPRASQPTSRPCPRADAGGLHTPPLLSTSTNGQWKVPEWSAEVYPLTTVKQKMSRREKAKGRMRMIEILLTKYPHPTASQRPIPSEYTFVKELVPGVKDLEKARRKLLAVSLVRYRDWTHAHFL